MLRELLKEILEFYHHEVVTADGGQAGLEIFRQARTSGHPFDVVMTDLGMPDVNGRQVAERIKADSPSTPVIMLTGWGNMLEERGETVPQVDAILTKPPRVTELVDVLTKLTGCTAPRDTSFFQRYNVRPRAAAAATASRSAIGPPATGARWNVSPPRSSADTE